MGVSGVLRETENRKLGWWTYEASPIGVRERRCQWHSFSEPPCRCASGLCVCSSSSSGWPPSPPFNQWVVFSFSRIPVGVNAKHNPASFSAPLSPSSLVCCYVMCRRRVYPNRHGGEDKEPRTSTCTWHNFIITQPLELSNPQSTLESLHGYI
jgi:hypothetical protein